MEMCTKQQQSPPKQQLDDNLHSTMTGDEGDNLNQQMHHQAGSVLMSAFRCRLHRHRSLHSILRRFHTAITGMQLPTMSKPVLPPGVDTRCAKRNMTGAWNGWEVNAVEFRNTMTAVIVSHDISLLHSLIMRSGRGGKRFSDNVAPSAAIQLAVVAARMRQLRKAFTTLVGLRVSITWQIEIISDPKFFPDELSVSDHTQTRGEINIPSTKCGGAAALVFLTDTEQQSPAKRQLDQNLHSTMTGDEGDNLNQQIHHQADPGTNAGPPPPSQPPQASSPFPSNTTLPEPAHRLSTMSEVVLPPDLNLDRRLVLLERWINSISLDAPTNEETSVTEIEILINPKVLSISCIAPTQGYSNLPNTSVDGGGNGRAEYYRHVQQQLQSQGGSASSGGGDGGDEDAANRGTTTTTLNGNRLSPQPNPSDANHQSPAFAGPTTPSSSSSGSSQITRMFKDYFLSGKCPSIREVRRRTTNSQLLDGRTVKFIWKKVKQLQASGRWIEHILL
ncbi:unnamed protein product [Mesocestoides corti]|uniref:Uncharacterized protein n=1 Tax=Mesocestoides corti TaxID=53468 RepID=A0A158QT54_MESCO|nr:unnamed protein product [Mesocestoides corti]